MTSLFQDLRYGARMLTKTPGFTLLAVITLALGIGANTAIFTIVNAVLLRSLPYSKADELVGIYMGSGPEESESRYPFAPAAYLNLKATNSSFTDMGVLSNKGWAANLTDAGEAERLQGYEISGNLFSVLGVSAELGRTFTNDDDQPGNNRVVVLNHDFWQRRFGADRSVVGRALTLNGDS